MALKSLMAQTFVVCANMSLAVFESLVDRHEIYSEEIHGKKLKVLLQSSFDIFDVGLTSISLPDGP